MESSEKAHTAQSALESLMSVATAADIIIQNSVSQASPLSASRQIDSHVEVDSSNLDGSQDVISAMTLQDGESTTQFFIEHITSDGHQLQSVDAETIQIGVDPSLSNIAESENVPLLLRVSEDVSDEGADLQISDNNVNATLDGTVSSGDMTQTMYTIHLTEDHSQNAIITSHDTPKNSSNEEQNCASNNSIDEISAVSDRPTLQFLTTAARLEDFMDVVTTYKCKFCRFCCAWKSGLVSHIRNCHLEANRSSVQELTCSTPELLVAKQEPDDSTPEACSDIGENSNELQPTSNESVFEPLQSVSKDSTELRSDVLIESSESTPQDSNMLTGSPPPPQERHIFLCGQCSVGFSSLEGCKQHMIKDHNLKLEPSVNKDKKVVTTRKRGRPKTRVSTPPSNNKICDDDFSTGVQYDEESEDSGRLDDDESLPAKRKIRPPKALEEDYFLGPRRKKMRRESLSDRTYRCNERGCGYRFTNEANLQYHARCHTVEEKPFVCPECCEYLDHWRGLAMHLWKLHSIDMDLHTCSVCGYKTYSLFKLDNHRRIHSEEREFICTTCGKGFKQLSQLRNHHVIHLDRKNMAEKRWYSEQECEICHRTFSDSKCLRKHQQAVHNKLKPYVCTYCGHLSARKAMLQLHMRQHTGEKPFICEHCEYRTGDHNSLRRHRMRHTGTKPYKCPHCPYACIQAISYKTHLKNKHPGMDGLYACTFCTFRSVSKENYINHMSDHRRGDIPIYITNVTSTTNNNSHSTENNVSSEHVTVQAPTQLHLPENALQQLEGILPGNISAAQLIYNCLNALSQEGGSMNLPPGVTASSTGDGTQTITIQLPTLSSQDLAENEQYYFAIQQQDGSTTALLSPSSLEMDDAQVSESTEKMTVLHSCTSANSEDNHSIDASVFLDQGKGHMIIADSNQPLIISHSSEESPQKENASSDETKIC